MSGELKAFPGHGLPVQQRASAKIVNADLVERLETLLDEAKKGELQGIAYAALYGEIDCGAHNKHSSSWVFPEKMIMGDRYRVAGMMFALATSLTDANNEHERSME